MVSRSTLELRARPGREAAAAFFWRLLLIYLLYALTTWLVGGSKPTTPPQWPPQSAYFKQSLQQGRSLGARALLWNLRRPRQIIQPKLQLEGEKQLPWEQISKDWSQASWQGRDSSSLLGRCCGHEDALIRFLFKRTSWRKLSSLTAPAATLLNLQWCSHQGHVSPRLLPASHCLAGIPVPTISVTWDFSNRQNLLRDFPSILPRLPQNCAAVWDSSYPSLLPLPSPFSGVSPALWWEGSSCLLLLPYLYPSHVFL